MTEHPNTQDYINRAERNRDYWLEEAGRHVSPEAQFFAQGEAGAWDREVEQLRNDMPA